MARVVAATQPQTQVEATVTKKIDDPNLGAKVDEWMTAVYPRLHRSSWAPSLRVRGVDVLDVLGDPVYLALLAAARGIRDGVKMRRRRSILAAVTERVISRVRTPLAEKRARCASASPGRVSVVFWPREPTHVQVQHPVGIACQDMKIESGFLVCQPAILDRLQRLGIPATYTRSVWEPELRRARRDGRRSARLLAADPGIALPAFPLTRGAREGVEVLRRRAVRLLPLVHEAIATADALTDSMSPKVLVVGNDLTLEGRAACLRAQIRGVRTVCLMHGSVCGDDGRQAHHLSDMVLVFGDNSKRQLLSQAVEPSRIAVCGAPHLDKSLSQTGRFHHDVRTRFSLSEKPLILVALSGPGHSVSHSHHETIIEHVMRLSTKLHGIRFIAKLHRKDRADYYQHVMRRVVPKSTMDVVPYGVPGLTSDIFDWLQGCSLVLTGASTVAVEAMLMDVPVVTMDFAGELSGIDFIDAGATFHARTPEELEDAVRSVLDASGRVAGVKARARAFLKGEYYAVDGRSAERCAETISGLV